MDTRKCFCKLILILTFLLPVLFGTSEARYRLREEVPPYGKNQKLITDSFKSCGVTNSADGSEDGQIHCFKEDGPVLSGQLKLKLAREEKKLAKIMEEEDLGEEEENMMNKSDASIDVEASHRSEDLFRARRSVANLGVDGAFRVDDSPSYSDPTKTRDDGVI